MNSMEILIAVFALFAMVFSFVTLYLTYEWKNKTNKQHYEMDVKCLRTKQTIDDLDTLIFNMKEDLFNLKNAFYSSGLETLKVRSEDHDKSIDAIRKDMLDLQVITGTLPSKAGTMREEVENTLEALESVQSAYKETRAIVDRMKEQMESLAKAYSEIHFTSKEFEEMRDELNDLSRRTA